MAMLQKSIIVRSQQKTDIGSDTQLVPDDSMMTNEVLTELAGLGKGSAR